jgi:hypothetical protein
MKNRIVRIPRALVSSAVKLFAQKGRRPKGRPCNTEYWILLYRPAAAPAAAGIIPAIFIPSIRASTVSRLAPVSVHAST